MELAQYGSVTNRAALSSKKNNEKSSIKIDIASLLGELLIWEQLIFIFCMPYIVDLQQLQQKEEET